MEVCSGVWRWFSECVFECVRVRVRVRVRVSTHVNECHILTLMAVVKDVC